MKNQKTTKSNCSGEDILEKLIELYEHQEQIKIIFKVKRK